MNEKVKEFLDEKKAEARAKYEERRDETLVGLGLCEREYAPDGKYSVKYNLAEWDKEARRNKYYRLVAVEVTDEEYLEILKVTKKEDKIATADPVATALAVIAWITYIGGIIAGIIVGAAAEEFVTTLVFWASAFITGTMFLGFSRIINLLVAIKQK